MLGTQREVSISNAGCGACQSILAGEPIKLFNHGNHTRDFTYVDDIAEGVIRASDQIAAPNPNWSSDQPDPATSRAPFRIFNIGNNQPVHLTEYVTAVERRWEEGRSGDAATPTWRCSGQSR